ncbi:MAG TPA: deoxyribonuclease V [Syntrophales bacterium]|nr:deoxyribonuclease V [Syntrophales bacterium]HPQ44324.1 deoxyribonuclease V [Syntrophales bacterium]
MNIEPLHDWNISYEKARKIQNELRETLILDSKDLPDRIETIAGADISYSRNSNLFFAAVAIFDFATMEIIEQASASGTIDFPYIPGLLTFREGPILLEAFRKVAISPDVIIFDGHGISHPRGIGLASHMGLFLNIPSIGCAKTLLVGSFDEPGNEPGDTSPLLYDGETRGAVLRTKRNVKPVFVSQGHKIGLDRAVDIILSSCRGYRLPEPTRKAHLIVNELRLQQEC